MPPGETSAEEDQPSPEEQPNEAEDEQAEDQDVEGTEGDGQVDDDLEDGENDKGLEEQLRTADIRLVTSPQLADEQHPPRKVQLTNGGVATAVGSGRAKVTIELFVRTTVKCPCSSSCKKMVKTGTLGILGLGSWSCPHCGHTRGARSKTLKAFAGRRDLQIHLKSAKCRASRGLPPLDEPSDRDFFEDEVAEELSLSTYKKVVEEEETGVTRTLFVCPQCKKEGGWKSRFNHARTCFKNNGFPKIVKDRIDARNNVQG